jgi:hypothetical protein
MDFRRPFGTDFVWNGGWPCASTQTPWVRLISGCLLEDERRRQNHFAMGRLGDVITGAMTVLMRRNLMAAVVMDKFILVEADVKLFLDCIPLQEA